MIRPKPGLQAFVEGKPMEFLHKISDCKSGFENWRVRPIFVTGPDRNQLVSPHDRISPIHTQHNL